MWILFKQVFRRPSNAGASKSLNLQETFQTLAFLAIQLERFIALQLYLPSLQKRNEHNFFYIDDVLIVHYLELENMTTSIL